MDTQNTKQQTSAWSKKTLTFVISTFVILVLVSIAWAAMTQLRKTEQGGMETGNIDQMPATTTDTQAPAEIPTTDDSNGSGQSVNQAVIPSTGYQSPVTVNLYYKHIVGGDTKNLPVDKQVQIKPWAVLEDSRCAADVQCIWAGRVRVGVQFTDPETGADIVASQVLEPGQSATVRNLKITLLEVKPENKSNVKIQDEQYRFIFGIEKLPN